MSLIIQQLIHTQVNHEVRPDSVMILRASQEVVAQEEFDDMLDTTRDRVDQIEGQCLWLGVARHSSGS